ncbi:hypothetical protein [Streptomyces sp. NPDC096152]|uniref:hypothetical protein n=1 Tax=Streptomyces sp. NPDC096152 TaxID=3366078 RepID=UPI003826DF46
MDGGLAPENSGDVITRLGRWADLPVRHTGYSPRRGAAESYRRASSDRRVIAKSGG